MAERTKGIYRLVTLPRFYEWLQSALSGPDLNIRLQETIFSDVAGKNILEIGCGPGRWVKPLNSAAYYTGIDWNPRHIRKAEEEFGSKTTSFICGDISDEQFLENDVHFDFVIGIGILHHLDNTTAAKVLGDAAKVLKSGGVYIGLEPVLHARQNPIARLLKALDSGKHVRDLNGYKSMFSELYADIDTEIKTDLMRIPYSHVILRARREIM
jgi:SAM-dependent methyltransferase